MASQHRTVALSALFSILCVKLTYSAPSPKTFSFGTIEGTEILSEATGRPVHAYYSIPFAQPPVGPLRFKPPVPYTGSNPGTVISSNGIRSSCVQAGFPGLELTSIPQSEDCLHLNIFTPADAADAPGTPSQKKVMVWIHGGGYIAGDATVYIPTDLAADYDVIVVTVHYRLGYFGFVSTGDAAAPGNNGLRDQVLALQWVKDNIRAFGGDPDDVTVFGESAGAGSVSFLSLSPYSKGLFTKAVMQSGTVFTPWSNLPPRMTRENLYTTAARLSCLPWWSLGSQLSYHNDILDCLRTKPASTIEAIEDWRIGKGNPFFDLIVAVHVGPTVDGDFIPGDPMLLLQDYDYLQRNGVLDRKYIAGTTNDEGMSLGLPPHVSDSGMRTLAKFATETYFPLGANDEMADLVDFFYSYPRQPDGRPDIQNLADVITDVSFVVPTVTFVNMLSEISPATEVYLYLFDHYPDLVNTTLEPIKTPHSWDVLYLFDKVPAMSGGFFVPEPNVNTAASRGMSDIIRGYLTQFAKTGNPSRFPANWPRYDLEDQQFMNMAPRPEVKTNVYAKRVSLWNDFLPKLATNIFTGRRGWQ